MMRGKKGLLILLAVVFISNCHSGDSKGTTKGKQDLFKHFTFLVNDGFTVTEHDYHFIFKNSTDRVLIDVNEIEYKNNNSEENMKSQMKGKMPSDTILISSIKNNTEYYGYYEYFIEKDGGIDGFIGIVFGKKASLKMTFSFADIRYLEEAKKIWMSVEER